MKTFKIKSYVIRFINIDLIKSNESEKNLVSVLVSINNNPEFISYALISGELVECKSDNDDFKKLINYKEEVFKIITSEIYKELKK